MYHLPRYQSKQRIKKDTGNMNNKTIIVTGATSGIGWATALRCALLGANVMACGRRQDRGQALVKAAQDYPGEITFVQTDVTQIEAVRALISATLTTYGSLDYAFNNAGYFSREAILHKHADTNWHAQLAVGLTGTYLCMKLELQAMLEFDSDGQHRAIVNNASTVAHRASLSSNSAYTAVKHGIYGLTKQSAVEYADTHIRINAISPGPTMTEATTHLGEAPAVELRTKLQTLNPTAALVGVQDIADAVIYLCSAPASMINGHALPLDGGQLAKL